MRVTDRFALSIFLLTYWSKARRFVGLFWRKIKTLVLKRLPSYTMFPTVFLFLAVAVFPYSHCAQFSATSPEDGATVHVCVTNSLVLPWTLHLDSGDVIESVKWYFTRKLTRTAIIAFSGSGMFYPLPPYTDRLQILNASGLELSNVTEEDAGNYAVKVIGRDRYGSLFTVERSAHVQAADDLHTTDNDLHVTFGSVAVQDSTGRRSVELHCGTFNYPSHPPFDVEWLFPSGDTINGSAYNDGHFIMWLSAPVDGGNYTCRIPPASSDKACLSGDSDKGEATLFVDGTEVRLMLLEAHQVALQEENDNLKVENSELGENLTSALAQLNNQVTSRILRNEVANTAFKGNLMSKLLKAQAAVRQVNFTSTNLAFRVNTIEAKNRRQVSFYGGNLLNTRPRFNATLVYKEEVINVGNAFNYRTGYFTAPYSGVYVFTAVSGSDTDGRTVTYVMMSDKEPLAMGRVTDAGDGEMSSVQAIVRLTRGQRAWLKSSTATGVTWYPATSFSGFLLYPD